MWHRFLAKEIRNLRIFDQFMSIIVTGIGGLAECSQNLTSVQARELDIEDTVISTTGSKGLQEAFCKHEDLLLSKLKY